jgi:hypothetical protein
VLTKWTQLVKLSLESLQSCPWPNSALKTQATHKHSKMVLAERQETRCRCISKHPTDSSQMTRRPSKSSKSKFRGISRKWLTFYDTSELNCLEIFVHWLKFSFWQLREKFKHFIANRNVARFARIFKPTNPNLKVSNERTVFDRRKALRIMAILSHLSVNR